METSIFHIGEYKHELENILYQVKCSVLMISEFTCILNNGISWFTCTLKGIHTKCKWGSRTITTTFLCGVTSTRRMTLSMPPSKPTNAVRIVVLEITAVTFGPYYEGNEIERPVLEEKVN